MAVIRFIKRQTVFCIAAVLALITCFFVPIDKQYLDYSLYPIANDMALITFLPFSEYRILYPDGTKRYLAMFTAINFVFLGIMLICAKLFFV